MSAQKSRLSEATKAAELAHATLQQTAEWLSIAADDLAQLETLVRFRRSEVSDLQAQLRDARAEVSRSEAALATFAAAPEEVDQ